MVLVACSIALILFAASCGDDDAVNEDPPSGEVHWGYEGDVRPASWGDLSPDFALCSSGTEQSPIDITEITLLDIADLAFSYEPSAVNILNNGHTIQSNYDAGSSIEVDGTAYDLLQIHFHGPSEHTVNGDSFEMEMHLVHRSAAGGLAVVGVLIEDGADNEAFAPIWDNLPAEESEEETIDGVTVNAESLLPAERLTYRYDGSLTTPPCSEGVKWFVLATPIALSNDQVAAFEAIIENNNRPVQPLGAREVSEDSSAD